MGTSATRAKNKYNSKNYEQVHIILPVGTRAVWHEAAHKNMKSLNEFIITAVEEKLKK